MKKTRGNYPAPLKILDAVEAGLVNGYKEGCRVEARLCSELAMTPECGALMGLFHGQNATKKNRLGKPAHAYSNITVLGAGLMGSGIAHVSAKANLDVTLKDVTADGVAKGLQAIHNSLSQRVKRKSMTEMDRDKVVSRIQGMYDAPMLAESWHRRLRGTDMVIEAVFEDLALKHKIVKDLEAHIPSHCIIASNTSALPIASIAEGSKRPENIVGMHYFSPVDKMPLLEVIQSKYSSEEAVRAAVAVGVRQKKCVIVVKDGPGFYTTRALAPFVAEASQLLREGVSPSDLDKHMLDFGFPVGPITLLDEVGLDVALHVQKFFSKAFGSRLGDDANGKLLEELVQRQFLGRKSGKGWFLYNPKVSLSVLDRVRGKKPPRKIPNVHVHEILAGYRVPVSTVHSVQEIQMRMALRFVNEAALCLQEGILSTPLDGDVGAVFGLGFPPSKGGPFRWLDSVGTDKIVAEMTRLADAHGPRFAPAGILVDYAKSGKKFHAA
eukprot:TRINITY_DN12257_c0_g1::TRINITY_DN12257_c0_g1_i1::g.13032::m.13032 TRINITY_DN12257_c0_g1::TRINITY_DN12257_c0_g1_i1::g.13032  ORF type:complete len:495 (+),score=150.61,sp/P40939/ECHA_HUMAN/49.90/3e-160,3HCDH_N/PF02737.13/8.3e-53,3HCDH/PF00725.17/6.5e-24,3HCDH/PF00725.17/0.00046,NAD_binding_2/PF03446.10/0.07,Saccharop_dh/PF03435.13/0.07,DAO/PF01266.19/0.24 TRINITY_DN12257_c0_g1_i1:643-2127(+)